MPTSGEVRQMETVSNEGENSHDEEERDLQKLPLPFGPPPTSPFLFSLLPPLPEGLPPPRKVQKEIFFAHLPPDPIVTKKKKNDGHSQPSKRKAPGATLTHPNVTQSKLSEERSPSTSVHPPIHTPTIHTPVVIEAAPQLRDLQKEATSFVPTALLKKRPFLPGSTHDQAKPTGE